MIAYASYLPPNTNIPANAFITSIGNCAFSMFAGLAVFATLGFVAKSYDVKVTELETSSVIRANENEAGAALLQRLTPELREKLKKGIKSEALPAEVKALDAELSTKEQNALTEQSLGMSGPGLIFNTYPTTLNMIPFGTVFGVIFFFALIVAGLSSSISIIEAFSSALTDHFPVSRKVSATVLCVSAFVLGIPFATGGGLWLLDVVDHHLLTYGLVVVAILESIIVGWFFTARRLRSHIDEAAGLRMSHAGDRLMRVVLTILLGLTWYGLAKAGDAAQTGTALAMLMVLGTIFMVWMDEHWLDFDVKIVIPVLLAFIVNRTLLADFFGESYYSGYSGGFISVGVIWILVTVLIGFGLEEASSHWSRIAAFLGLKGRASRDQQQGDNTPDV